MQIDRAKITFKPKSVVYSIRMKIRPKSNVNIVRTKLKG